MPTLHLLNQQGDQYPQPKELKPGVWETGYWYLSETRAKKLIGHPLHLHRTKAGPSFLAGRVASYRRELYTNPSTGHSNRRTVFIFRESPDCQFRTESEGWSQAGIKLLS